MSGSYGYGPSKNEGRFLMGLLIGVPLVVVAVVFAVGYKVGSVFSK